MEDDDVIEVYKEQVGGQLLLLSVTEQHKPMDWVTHCVVPSCIVCVACLQLWLVLIVIHNNVFGEWQSENGHNAENALVLLKF